MTNATFPPLFNAKDIPLDRGGASPAIQAGPDLGPVLDPCVFSVIRRRQNPTSFVWEELDRRSFPTVAAVLPLKNRDLEIKPEGERRWTWLKVYGVPEAGISPNDVVKISGVYGIDPTKPWRVMGTKPWGAKGYCYLELVDDFQVPPNYFGYAPQSGTSRPS